jgi:hypothetical protein
MRTTTTLLTVALMIVAASTFAQTIRRVNNNAGITLDANMYASVQAAHDAAAPGDVIYVESSPDSYGNLTCTKELTFVGTGYLLNENQIYARATNTARLGNIAFKSGSEGSVIEGFKIEGTFDIIRASNITVRRNYMTSNHLYIYVTESGQQTTYSSVSNILITQNLLIGIIAKPTKVSTVNYTISNITITNNRLGQIYFDDQQTYHALVLSAAVINNIFTYGMPTPFSNTNVHNNIFVEPTSSQMHLGGANNTISNNLSADVDCLPAGNGNVNGIILANTFLGWTGYTEDSQWKLKTGSPAIGVGVGGVDCGMYGGATPYVLSGVPAHPTINFMNSTGVGNSTTPLNVTISTKSNN